MREWAQAAWGSWSEYHNEVPSLVSHQLECVVCAECSEDAKAEDHYESFAMTIPEN